jgi:hypothetical protein
MMVHNILKNWKAEGKSKGITTFLAALIRQAIQKDYNVALAGVF